MSGRRMIPPYKMRAVGQRLGAGQPEPLEPVKNDGWAPSKHPGLAGLLFEAPRPPGQLVDGGRSDRARLAWAASCTLDDTPSLPKTWERWVSTVRREMNRRRPISTLVSP
jgi:hypothetical protein